MRFKQLQVHVCVICVTVAANAAAPVVPLNASYSEAKKHVQKTVASGELCEAKDPSSKLLCIWKYSNGVTTASEFNEEFTAITKVKIPRWWLARFRKLTVNKKGRSEALLRPSPRGLWNRNTQGILFNGIDGVVLGECLTIFNGEKLIDVPYESNIEGDVSGALGVSCVSTNESLFCVVTHSPTFGDGPTDAFCTDPKTGKTRWKVDLRLYTRSIVGTVGDPSSTEIRVGRDEIYIFHDGWDMSILGMSKIDGKFTLRFSTDFCARGLLHE